MVEQPRNRPSRPERSIHRKFCSAQSTDLTLEHSVNSGQRPVVDFIESTRLSIGSFKSRYVGGRYSLLAVYDAVFGHRLKSVCV